MGSYGGDRWRDRGQGNWNRDRESGRGEWGRGDYRGGSGRVYRGDEDDRGFIERAGDEVRSWFGDEEAQRRREEDERRWAREQGLTGRRDNDYGRSDYGRGPGSFGGGGFGGGWGNQRGESWNRDRPGEREGWFSDSLGGERGERLGGRGGYDPHYSEWRRRQIEDLDRDYDEYRREHQSKFEQEFGSWRSKRQGQRQALGRVTEHMEVTGSDGSHVGTVDKVRGDRIILTRSDPEAGGIHHSIPCSWVETIDDKVMLNRTAEEAKHAWRSEERSRAMFGGEEGSGEGPHNLNRSFSGTYSGRRE